MTYIADPADAARPLDADDASGGAAELRALKGYLQGLIGGGTPINGYSYQAFRNKLLNGNFDIAQTNLTSLAAGTGRRLLADMWETESNGTTIAPSLQAFALGQTAVPDEPTSFHRCVVASVAGASNYGVISQRIEDVRTLAGRTFTLSFYAKADAIKDIAIDCVQNFGTGGAPSALVSAIGVVRKTLGTSYQLFTTQITFPSISGKTIGTNADSYTELVFWMDAGTSFNARTLSLGQQSGTFDFSHIQLEPGGSATPFELRPLELELLLCQRYYWRMTVLAATGASGFMGQCVSATQAIMSIKHPVKMRAAPSLVENSGLGVTNATAGVINVTARALNNSYVDGASVSLTVAAGLVAGDVTLVTGTGALAFSAKL